MVVMVVTTSKRCKKSHNKPNTDKSAATLKMRAILDCVMLEMKASRSFETSATDTASHPGRYAVLTEPL